MSFVTVYLLIGLYLAYRDVVRCEQRWLNGLRPVIVTLVVVFWGPAAVWGLWYRWGGR